MTQKFPVLGVGPCSQNAEENNAAFELCNMLFAMLFCHCNSYDSNFIEILS